MPIEFQIPSLRIQVKERLSEKESERIRPTPFRLAFGLEAVMPVEFQIPSLRIQVKERLSEKESERIRLATLLELEENRIANLL